MYITIHISWFDICTQDDPRAADLVMSRRDRELQEAEALRSDPEDDDYDDRAVPASAKKRKAVRPSSGSKVTKRRRRNASDNDIVDSDDDDDLSIDNSTSGESVTLERTVTGRPRRAVTKRTATLKESSDEEGAEELELIEDIDTDESSPKGRPTRHVSRPRSSDPRHAARSSLIVKLKVPVLLDPETDMIETRGSSDRVRKATKDVEVHRRLGTRRSSRQSEGELYELTNSGRHAQPVSNRSITPELVVGRQTRGAKRIPGTGAIIEASQEDAQASMRVEADEEGTRANQRDLERGSDSDGDVVGGLH